ncbi:NAD-dependent epimerase/dehydratase family protein [Piscinibacter koreensis]|uniref:NAD(P)H-binding protein n=1 Tax=Piscinibacter koreensis TaxID=2742824 RepID=A0A7Y6NLL1_9BURK|nr:NAD-dependent epimerase/dehydratase family protein [Schlegelella koreensis]NUZ05446.1 NAD(P)H-binding protein [Schlegelella koreensis]
MPMSPAGVSRFRRPVLLIVGCGDVGLRVARRLAGRWRVLALTTQRERVGELRAAGVVPLVGDLDVPATLGRLGGVAYAVLHLAPPPGVGATDPRSAALIAALARGGRVRRAVVVSTSGVYGDCAGARVDETRALRPTTTRARRRVDAERRWRHWGRAGGVAVTLLRVPGIYGPGRGEHPGLRGAKGQPVLRPEDDVYTNHVHADDLARACIAALHRGLPQRAVNVSDDSALRMADYFDRAADIAGQPRPERVSRAEAASRLGAASMSFLGESRRLVNTRLKRELRVRLRWPTVEEGLRDPGWGLATVRAPLADAAHAAPARPRAHLPVAVAETPGVASA